MTNTEIVKQKVYSFKQSIWEDNPMLQLLINGEDISYRPNWLKAQGKAGKPELSRGFSFWTDVLAIVDNPELIKQLRSFVSTRPEFVPEVKLTGLDLELYKNQVKADKLAKKKAELVAKKEAEALVSISAEALYTK